MNVETLRKNHKLTFTQLERAQRQLKHTLHLCKLNNKTYFTHSCTSTKVQNEHTCINAINSGYIDHNLPFTFIHLYTGLFIHLCIHSSSHWLSFYLQAVFQGERRRTFIFWWEQSLIQNRPILASLYLSVSFFSLCPSDWLSRTASTRKSVSSSSLPQIRFISFFFFFYISIHKED